MSRRQQSRKQRRKSPDYRQAKDVQPHLKHPLADASLPSSRLRSKKEIPVLSAKEDLPAAFGVVDEIPSFAATIDQTLVQPAGQRALQERVDNLQRDETDSKRLSVGHYPSPETELDLHGCTGPEAEKATRNFIGAARHRGLLTLRVITGKGLHSQGPAVLPDVVEQLLRELKEEGEVFTFRWEKKEKQKSGAVIVYLP